MARKAHQSLAGISLLSGISPTEVNNLERACSWRRYGAKEQIFDHDSEGNDVYFVVDGNVQILNYSPSGREISFAHVKTGGYFGELAALDGGTRSASVMAVEESALASISSQAFRKLVLDHPEIAFEVLLNLTGMVRSADARIMDLSTLSAINRVHTELLRMSSPTEPESNVGVIHPIPTHNDIASRAGTTRETVSRVLSNLARVMIIERTSDALNVLDLRRLNDLIEPTGEPPAA